MKRKVIQIANSTQLISLPREWAKKNNIAKGDELEVTPGPRGLLVSVEEIRKETRTISLKITDNYSSLAILSSLYKAGYDEMRLDVSGPEQIATIQDFVSHTCVGFGVVDQGRNHLVVRKLSDSIPEEFGHVLKRLLVFIGNMAKEMTDAAANHDAAGYANIVLMDVNVNKFSFFCLRLLTKHPETIKESIGPMYDIVDQLEGIGDAYKHLARSFAPRAPSKATVNALKSLDSFLDEILSLLRSRKQEHIPRLVLHSKQTKDIVDSLVSKKGQITVHVAFVHDLLISIRSLAIPTIQMCFDDQILK